MNKGFYLALEDKFRCSEEIIKNRQSKYLKFLNQFKQIKKDIVVFDIGCGRGEWLDLLKNNGFCAKGIDIDDDMVKLSVKKGLDVVKSDAIFELKKLESSSIDVISAFHVVEHIPFDDVLEICKEAMRVLTPCGILILETPNPENIIVSTQRFYLDPTHRNPIPHELLAFATEYSGFARNCFMRLNGEDSILYKDDLSIFEVFWGVSPDYSIVSQKQGDQMHLFDSVFKAKGGIGLEDISRSYTRVSTQYLSTFIDELNSFKNKYDIVKNELDDIKQSRSWRITKPLRIMTTVVKKVILFVSNFFKKKPTNSILGNNLTARELEIYKRLKKG